MSTSRKWQLMHIWKYLTVGVVTDSSYSNISVTVIVLQELQQFCLVFVTDKNRTSGMVLAFLGVNLAISELAFLNWFQSCHISTFSFQPNLPHCTDWFFFFFPAHLVLHFPKRSLPIISSLFPLVHCQWQLCQRVEIFRDNLPNGKNGTLLYAALCSSVSTPEVVQKI